MVRKKWNRFRGRSNVSGNALLSMFRLPGLSDVECEDFLDLIQRLTDIPKGLLRPNDTFEGDLWPEKGWEFDDGLNLLPDAVRRRFGGSRDDYDLASNPTIDALLRAVQRSLQDNEE